MIKKIGERHILLWGSLGLLYSLFLTLGRMIDKYGHIYWEGNSNFLWICLGMLIGIGVGILADIINKNKEKLNYSDSSFNNKIKLVILIINYIFYLILLLGVFPGFFVYDAQDELLQVITRDFNLHHPIFHVLYMGGFIQAGYKIFGSYNAGIFFFSLIQILFFSYGNLRILSFLKKCGVNRILLILTDIFLISFAPIEMMVLCSTKDSVFALCVVLWVITFFECRYNANIRRTLELAIWTAGMCVVRNNAIYAIAAFLLLYAVLYRKSSKLIASILLGVIFAIVSNQLLSNTFKAKEIGKQEMLTVPIQQMARTYNFCDENGFTDEEKEILFRYIPEEYLNNYEPKVSDMVKVGFENTCYENDKESFWRLWFTGLKRNPMSYLNAWLLTSYGYYYPNATIDAYKGHVVFTFTYDESSYFGYETEAPGERHSFIPGIDKYFKYLSLEKVKEDNILLGLLLSPGLVVWIYLGLFAIMLVNKKEQNEAPCIYFLLVVATLLIGPICLPRYVFFLWYGLPIMLTATFKG